MPTSDVPPALTVMELKKLDYNDYINKVIQRIVDAGITDETGINKIRGDLLLLWNYFVILLNASNSNMEKATNNFEYKHFIDPIVNKVLEQIKAQLSDINFPGDINTVAHDILNLVDIFSILYQSTD